ncbi:MAG TPA: hypothetical protein V6C99_11955 [Oculatellaceae cyanobacterium]|jgi:hypothetical protein
MTRSPEIFLTDSLRAETRNIIELAKPYNTVILLYGDDFSDRILGSWAELDRLNLPTRRIGQVYSGIEVHTFGLDEFPEGTVLEVHVREAPRDTIFQDPRRSSYRSLLNELSIISVQVRQRALDNDFLSLLS